MKSMKWTWRAVWLLAACGVAAGPVDARNQDLCVDLPPIVSDSTFGALDDNTVYRASAAVTVPQGHTLTIESGAVIKFAPGASLQVHGLLVTGVDEPDITWFTSLNDTASEVGGETCPGLGGPAPGDWVGIVFHSTSVGSVLVDSIVRFAGEGGGGAIQLDSANVTIGSCNVENSAGAAIDCKGHSFPQVSFCLFSNNDRTVVNVPIAAVPGIVNNQATGSVTSNAMVVDDPGGDSIVSAGESVDITVASLMGEALDLRDPVSVHSSATLSLGPGVVLKLGSGTEVRVDGTLLCNGGPGLPADAVVFTSIADDTGGDTGGDGPTTGGPGSWGGIVMGPTSDASELKGVHVRQAGEGGQAAIQLEGSDLSMTTCTVEDCAGAALSLGSNSFPAVDSCTFANNARSIVDAPLTALPGLSANTASGNTLSDAIVVNDPGGTSFVPDGTTTTIGEANLIAGALLLTDPITVNAAGTLELQPGVVMKFGAGQALHVAGRLVSVGSGAHPVVLTSVADDLYGGDTDLDGPSSGAPGDWIGVTFQTGLGANVVQHTRVRYFGEGGAPGLHLQVAEVDLQVTQCFIEHGAGPAFDLGQRALPSVSSCTLTGNLQATANVPLQAVPGFVGNLSADNVLSDVLEVNDPGGASFVPGGTTTTISAANLMGGALHMGDPVVVSAGGVLELQPGVVLKFRTGQGIDVVGRLTSVGSAAAPVVLTSLADDEHGGDTNLDGPSSGAPGDWRGVAFVTGTPSNEMRHTRVRHFGEAGAPGVHLQVFDVDVDLVDCRIERGAGPALDLASAALPEVVRCSFDDNQRAVVHARLASLAGFSANSAAGNALSDVIEIDEPGGAAFVYAGESITIGPRHLLGGVLHVLEPSFNVLAGGTLTLEAGTTVKFVPGAVMTVDGALHVRGSGLARIGLTVLTDDELGGDTNKDGAGTAPAPGEWAGLRMEPGAAGELDHLRVRYGGAFGARLMSPNVSANALRVDHAQATGVQVGALLGDATNWIVYRAGQLGIDLTGGTFDVVHATVTECGQLGVDKFPEHTGIATGCIVWANGSGAFDGFAPGEVRYSNGDPALAGTDGNLYADPLFVDAPGGDLRLQPTSPCLGAADLAPALALVTDHDEQSRLLDHSLSGVLAADMGAHELAVFDLAVGGGPVLGTSMSFAVSGPEGFAAYYLGFLNGTSLAAPYGFVTLGKPSSLILLALLPVGVPTVQPIPKSPALAGLELGIQAIAVPADDPNVGNTTRLARLLLRP